MKQLLLNGVHTGNRLLDWVWLFLHKGLIVRRIVLFWALWQSTSIINHTIALINAHPWDANAALIIGAYLTPILTLTGFIIKSYAEYTTDNVNALLAARVMQDAKAEAPSKAKLPVVGSGEK